MAYASLQKLRTRFDDMLANWSVFSLCVGVYLFSASLILSAGFVRFYRGDVDGFDFDELEYWNISDSILAGKFEDPGRRTLAFPLLIAAIKLLSREPLFVQVALSLIAASAPPLLGLGVLRVSGSRLAAVTSGFALSVWPPQIFYSASLYSEALALPAFLLFLAVLPTAVQEPKPWTRWVLAGLMLGITAHVRTMYQLFVPFALLVLLLEFRNLRSALKKWGLLVCGFLLAVLPWSIYVSAKLEQPILLTANGGETLAGGYTSTLLAMREHKISSEARSYWVGPGKWVPMAETGYLSPSEEQLPYAEKSNLLQKRVLGWVIDNPGDALYLLTRKLSYMWGIYPLTSGGTTNLIFGNLPIIFLSLAFIYCLAAYQPVFWLPARLYLMPLFVSAVAVISWGSWRFRQPADAAMLAVVSCALALAAERRTLAIHRPASHEGAT